MKTTLYNYELRQAVLLYFKQILKIDIKLADIQLELSSQNVSQKKLEDISITAIACHTVSIKEETKSNDVIK